MYVYGTTLLLMHDGSHSQRVRVEADLWTPGSDTDSAERRKYHTVLLATAVIVIHMKQANETYTALAPQLFRDLVVRSFCVSRFTVNKKA